MAVWWRSISTLHIVLTHRPPHQDKFRVHDWWFCEVIRDRTSLIGSERVIDRKKYTARKAECRLQRIGAGNLDYDRMWDRMQIFSVR